MSAPTVRCARCGRDELALSRPPFAGKLGQEILARIGAECWSEWRRVEVMVINELRLNFMDPAAQEILAAEMRRFLGLDGQPGGEPEKHPESR